MALDPAAAAMPYLDEAKGTVKEYLDPYSERGGRAGDFLEDMMARMGSDPQAFINEIMGGYAPSKGYQFQQERMGQAAANTAAAGGMRGSPREQTQQQQITQSLLSQDMQNWLNNILGVQDRGLGIGQNLYGTGFGAAGQLAGDLSNILGTQGSLAFQGERQKMQDRNSLINALMGMAGTGVGAFMGGPGGAAIGKSISDYFGG